MSRTTVILVNFKGAADTSKCLCTLYANKIVPRIVVVDNTPDDPELLDVLAHYPEVHLISSPGNIGFGRGNNLGIDWAMSQTNCEFLFIFNNDATVECETIARLEAVLDAHPLVGIVAPRVVFMEKPDVLWYGGGEVSWWRGGGSAPGIFGASNAPLAMQAREVSFASGCAMLLRRELMQKLVGFDERFFMYEEDLELCLRTQQLGWLIRYEPAALVLHKVQASSRGGEGYVDMLSPDNRNLPFYIYHVMRNRLLNMRLYAKGKNKLVFNFGFPIFILKKILEYTLKKRWDGLLAMYQGWRSYRELGIYESAKIHNKQMLAQLNTLYIKLYLLGAVRRLISYTFFEGRPLTVRGQWINPLVFAQLAIWKTLPQMRKVRKPIFILGMGRSGTTILGVLLSMHRVVGFLNEPKALWHTIYPHEDVIGSYERGEASYSLNAQDATLKVCQDAHKLFGGYLLSTLSTRVVDKYPELIFRVPFVRKIFPDARFVFLVRDGWETCASIDTWSKNNSETHHGETHDWWGVNQRKWQLMLDQLIAPDPYFANVIDAIRGFDRHLDMAATEWVVTMREGIRVKREYGAAVHLLKYEDLVNAPKESLDNLLKFCELPEDERFLCYAKETLRHVEPHAPYNLHPAILPLFRETLGELGYAS